MFLKPACEIKEDDTVYLDPEGNVAEEGDNPSELRPVVVESVEKVNDVIFGDSIELTLNDGRIPPPVPVGEMVIIQ